MSATISWCNALPAPLLSHSRELPWFLSLSAAFRLRNVWEGSGISKILFLNLRKIKREHTPAHCLTYKCIVASGNNQNNMKPRASDGCTNKISTYNFFVLFSLISAFLSFALLARWCKCWFEQEILWFMITFISWATTIIPPFHQSSGNLHLKAKGCHDLFCPPYLVFLWRLS